MDIRIFYTLLNDEDDFASQVIGLFIFYLLKRRNLFFFFINQGDLTDDEWAAMSFLPCRSPSLSISLCVIWAFGADLGHEQET